MAKQIGLIKIAGTIGDLTFYEFGGEHYVRRKSSLSAAQIKQDPNFERTRENNTEFGEASKLSKAIVSALQPHLIKRPYWFPKLNAISYRAVRKDGTNARGKRVLGAGNEYDYFGYDVGGNSDIFEGTLNLTYDRPSGVIDFEVLPFIPSEEMWCPAGSTHFDFVFGVGEIAMDSKAIVSKSSKASEKIDARQSGLRAVIRETLGVSAGSMGLVVGVFTIRFWQMTNGVYYRMFGKGSSGLVLISLV